MPPTNITAKIANALNVSTDYLIGRIDIPDPDITIFNVLDSDIAGPKKYALLHHFDKLNVTGQDKAVERVEELTKIEDYTVQDVIDMFRGKGKLMQPPNVDPADAEDKED